MTDDKINKSFQKYIGGNGLEPLLQDTYKSFVWALAQEEEREDIAQEGVISVWRSLDRTCEKPLKEFKPEMSAYATWSRLVLHTALVKYMRDKALDAITMEGNSLEYAGYSNDPWNSRGRRWTQPKESHE
jgi:DNA-directed RNA polymerase specialized sigma24 family protein